MHAHAFPRSERLKHKKAIGVLFAGVDGFFAYPLRVHFNLSHDVEPEVKIAFSISRRKCKLAVDRNRVRRRMREAWRLQRAPLLEACRQQNCQLHLMILYTGKPEDADYAHIEKGVLKIIQRLQGLVRPV